MLFRYGARMLPTEFFSNASVKASRVCPRLRAAPCQGSCSYRTVALTWVSIELTHHIGKRQFKLGADRWRFWSPAKQWDRSLA